MNGTRIRVICALVACAALRGGVAWAASTQTCLTGTDPSVATDAAQIQALRARVNKNCACADFDGSQGKRHADYVKCAREIVDESISITLRPQCVATVRRILAKSTCGMNPALHEQPCVRTAISSGKVRCSIQPTTRSDGTANDRCVSGASVSAVGCGGFTSCLDAADLNGDLLIDSVDGGACAPIGGIARPVSLHVPPSYTPGTAMPLVLLLHGYTASGATEEAYLDLTAQADQRGFLYAYPDGTIDLLGNRFWNATDACCNITASTVDDSLYLSGVIDVIAARYSVDAKRVYLVGHSNGGFMTYRMACDHGGKIAAIASLAGAMFNDLSRCTAASPVSVLEIHGTADGTIPYAGGSIQGHPYPGALTTVADWVSIDGCTNTPDLSAPPLDLISSLAGAETTVTRYEAGCMAASAVELWTMEGGTHVPSFTAQFAPDVIDFLLAHPKP